MDGPERSPEQSPPPPGDGRPPVERRSGTDRRGRPTPWMSRYWLRGRRRGGRRAEDRRQVYVDRYQWSDVLLVLGVVVLCAADYLLTLEVIQRGAIEANPLMDFLLRQGSGLFGAVKLGVTLLGMLFLLMHIRLQHVRAATLIVLALYTVLMLWHLWVSWDMTQAFGGTVRAAGG